ncbi:GDSL-type esterase/lipase family protein [Caviibacterium pharyngocola]|uniref:Acylneuraminate cytidylyltransferase n=1 Tax=Caviibacterium pharyngocola TaxID=28159 RepID=A0A2M8RXV6_9PAST|nr:GDSL-type esterase/lipase family protein [Caviibacterium pharyngocola]PJG83721.1 acylneuraminate cytidylyltransferase [Caviibacterium pharyngocola]
MLSDQDMFNRYKAKQFEFEQDADVSLLGHSLFDMWSDLPNYQPILAGQRVANMGLSGVSTYQYLDIIVRPQRIRKLGKTVFVFLGVNDILKEIDYSPRQVTEWLAEIFALLQQQSPDSRYFLLETAPVAATVNIDNREIRALNDYVKNHLPPNVTFIETYQAFSDAEQNLAANLTTDGVHFTAVGYDILSKLLTAHLTP